MYKRLNDLAHATLNWIKTHLKISIAVGIILFCAVTVFIIGWSYERSHRGEPTEYGVSFSLKYAHELGIDWRDAYMQLLDDLGFKKVRLMSYWDDLEPQMGQFKFDALDWQFNEAEKRGAKVSLAIGQRQPRWPECHIPGWAQKLYGDAYDIALKNYITATVKRYRHHPALYSYQLENEAHNKLFGECPKADRQQLTEEYSLIKSLDLEHDVVINASNQSGVPIRGPIGDQVGLSVYRNSYFRAFGRDWQWSFWYVPSWWHGFRAALIGWLHDSEVFIHELQAEPWGRVATVNLSIEEQDKSMDVPGVRASIAFARQTGLREVYLWGGEWWYWRKTAYNDPSIWQTVDKIINE